MFQKILKEVKKLLVQINGVGNGHIKQAKTVYDILIKKYEIPIVIIYKKKTNSVENFLVKVKLFLKI